MKKIIFIVSALFMSVFAISAHAPGDQQDYLAVIQKMNEDAIIARHNFDYKKAENHTSQAIMIFNTQPVKFQEDNRELKSELYYNLARYRAMQNKTDEALEAFAEAIDLGWDNHAFAEKDLDLDNIRRNKKFRQMMLAIKNS